MSTPLSGPRLEAYFYVIGESVELAILGRPADGYCALLGGMHRAQNAQHAGEPWGDELVGRYREALDRYAERWGIARE